MDDYSYDYNNKHKENNEFITNDGTYDYSNRKNYENINNLNDEEEKKNSKENIYLLKGDKYENVKESNYKSVESSEKKKKSENFLYVLCKKYVMFSLYRRSHIFLSIIIGYLCFILIGFSFYYSMFEKNDFKLFNNFAKQIKILDYFKLNIKQTGDILNQSSNEIGKNTKNFFKYYKKEKAATLLFYIDDKEFDNKILDYDILKDIFFLLEYFKQIKLKNNKKWKDICKNFDIPFSNTKCFVLGLFSISELQDDNYESLNNFNDYFNNLIEKNEGSIKIFFSNAVNFLPHFLYYPHTFSKEKKSLNDVVSDIHENLQSLIFVFNFDDHADESLLNEWYKALNFYVKLINEKNFKNITIINPDCTKFTHSLNYNKGLKIAVINDQILEENENTSLIIGIKSNYLFILFSMLFIILYVRKVSNKLKYKEKFFLIISVFHLSLFSFFSSFLFNLIFRISILRIFLLNYFVLYFLSFLFCCVNFFFYNKCLVACSKKILFKLKNQEYDNNEKIDMSKYYISATSKSLYFVGKIVIFLIIIYAIGLTCTYTVIQKFSLNSLFSLIALFFFYTFFFNNVFAFLCYKNNKTFSQINFELNEYIVELSKKININEDNDILKNDLDKNDIQNIHSYNIFNMIRNFSNLYKNDRKIGDYSDKNKEKNDQDEICLEDKMELQQNINYINNKYGESKKKSLYNPYKKVFLLPVMFLFLFFLAFLLYIFINNKTKIIIYSYISKGSMAKIFLENFEKKAGYIIEPGYLVLPSSSDFNYEKEENIEKIIKLIENLKDEEFINDPIISWVSAFKIIKNDCLNIYPFNDHYLLEDHRNDCNNFVSQNYNEKLYLNQLKDIFCNDELACNNFYQIIYQWINYKVDNYYESYLFQIRTRYQNKINELLPQFHTITPHLFHDNYIKMDKEYNINSSRIGFIFHNYASNYEKNFKNISKIKNILKNSNIKNVYFYSESYVLYNQAMNFFKEYQSELISYFCIFFILLYLFNLIGVLIIFQFWICNNLSLIYFIYFFPINTDTLTFIFLKITTVISISHYLYSTLFFNDVKNKRNNIIISIKESSPYLLFLALYLISFSIEDYVSNVLRLLILSHILWFLLYYFTIYCLHKIYIKSDL
ncbi:conserved Plasmodium protein, unknown function [Plasmodium gallinaceum]|uniref:SSD domain-containing protein n=1 Tax=Plasmodium gallinaceum TaxID=5849 RepID=A0A1J1GTM5_PLAGA|nr:conserved Plasmodium protein, unknown function [Plasmodium gallinaceum]CRG94654.1 conserved Plasmodium protein, unknown function [Plasmodium gallinaceum]